MTEISLEDKAQIDKLRERVGQDLLDAHPVYNTDFDILRWLQGFDYKIDVIVPKLRNHLLLRSAWKIDTIEDRYIQVNSEILRKYLHFGPLKTPESVREEYALVAIECFGKDDVEGIMKSVTMIDMYKWFVWMCETHHMRWIRERERLTGKQSWFILVMDFEGMPAFDVNLLKFASGRLGYYFRFILANYVDVMKKSIIINLPSVAYYVWNYVILPFLPEKTKEKIVILGSNWREEILDHVDPRALPVHWGGQMIDKDGDEMCRSMVNIPSKIPEKLYWSTRREKERYEEETFTPVSIPAGQWLFVEVAAEVGSWIEWIVFTASAFTISTYFSPSLPPVVENKCASYTVVRIDESLIPIDIVLPPLEMPGQSLVPEEDAFTCRWAGTYTICIRNTAYFAKAPIRLKISRNGESLRLSQK